MSTTSTPTEKWDVAADDGTEFVVSINGKTDAEKLAAEKLAEMGKPATTFTVTLAERASGDPLDLLSGIDPEPVQVKPGERASEAVKRTAAERQANPDPKPARRKQSGRKKAAPTAASTKKADAKPAAKPTEARAAKQKRAEKPATGQPRPGTARAACIAVLTDAGTPLKAKEIAKRVLDSGQVKNLTGKTPEASISALLVVSHQKGGDFIRTAPGTFGLRNRD